MLGMNLVDESLKFACKLQPRWQSVRL